MIPQIADMRHVKGHKIWLRFEDEIEGEVDLSDELWGEVFEPLRDVKYFQLVKLDRELNTIRWNNGADFAPEFLYKRIALG